MYSDCTARPERDQEYLSVFVTRTRGANRLDSRLRLAPAAPPCVSFYGEEGEGVAEGNE